MSSSLARKLANTLIALLLILGGLWVLFSLLYWRYEDYSLLQSAHWAMQTITTTGYGDVPPKTNAGLALAIMLQPAAVLTTLLLGANFVKSAIEDPNAFTHEEQLEARQCDDDTNARVRVLEAKLDQLLAKI